MFFNNNTVNLLLKAAKLNPNEISKVLGYWQEGNEQSMLVGLFFKFTDNTYGHSVVQVGEKYCFCKCTYYFQERPSLASLEYPFTGVYNRTKNWKTDTKSLWNLRDAVYSLKSSANSLPRIFSNASSPLVSRSPSPVVNGVKLSDIPPEDFYAKPNIPVFIDETESKDPTVVPGESTGVYRSGCFF